MTIKGLAITSLEEYEFNREFVGRNWNHGEVVELVLAGPTGKLYGAKQCVFFLSTRLSLDRRIDLTLPSRTGSSASCATVRPRRLPNPTSSSSALIQAWTLSELAHNAVRATSALRLIESPALRLHLPCSFAPPRSGVRPRPSLPALDARVQGRRVCRPRPRQARRWCVSYPRFFSCLSSSADAF